jgi:predicted ATPase
VVGAPFDYFDLKTALAYLPIIELLKQYFQIDLHASHVAMRHTVMQGLEALQADLEATALYLLHLLDPEAPEGLPPGMSPEAIKRKLFESLRWLLLEMSARRPLILAIEDLHWADQATIEFLPFCSSTSPGPARRTPCATA